MTKKPNLLIIWTDQQRNDTLPCHGNDYVDAPNLAQLAEESFVFRRAYCTQPVCTPSRGSIMTGLWPHTHGCYTNNLHLKKDEKTIAEMVSEDYLCAYYGKWHLGDELVAQHGFEDWISIEDGIYRPYYSTPEQLELRSSYHHFLFKNGFVPDAKSEDGGDVFSRELAAVMSEQFTKSHFLGKETERFLLEQKGSDRPFIMSVNMLEPHPPIFGPLNDHYDPEELPVGDAYMKIPDEDCSRKNRENALTYPKNGWRRYPLNTESDWRRLRANYYGLVTMVDRVVGRILKALEDSGHADDTIVVFTSDHGEMMGDHGLLGKGVMYEEASRIPLMIRVPWLSQSQTMYEQPVSHIDLVPTLLELMNEPVGDHLQGKSLAGVLRGEESLDGNEAIVEWNSGEDKNYSARTLISSDNWKLALYTSDQHELYDLNSDPCELTNRFNDPEQRDRIKAMASRIRAWQEQSNDSVKLPDLDI